MDLSRLAWSTLSRKGSPGGFSLVELLIVIALLAVLAGLLLPAVQSARETSRRTQCINQLRQLSWGLHLHESSHKALPAGYESYPTSDGTAPPHVDMDSETWDAGPGWGWGANLLPYLEEAALSDLGRHVRENLWHPDHTSLRETQVPLFLCPSASGEQGLVHVRDRAGEPLRIAGRELRLGRSHYVASHGQESCWGECGAAATALVFTNIYRSETTTVRVEGDISRVADGPFFRNSRTRFRDVKDGLSKTIFLGEHTSRLSDKTWVGVVPGAFTSPRIQSPENRPEAAATLVLVHAGPSGGELDITGFPIIHPVNFPTYHVGQMSSDHPGGGVVSLGDASARFVSEDVDLFLWAEYSSMNEQEVSHEL